MKFTVAIFCIACATPALAQSGVTNIRDGYGNLVRDRGVNAVRDPNQAGNNGTVKSTLGPTTPINSRPNRVQGK